MTGLATRLGGPSSGARKVATYPVMELFGPTLQGEGPQQGQPAYFVRFGGCDFRCSWCDSMHAVDPAVVREEARRMSTREIVDGLGSLPSGPQLVVISGGNPALHDLRDLANALHAGGRSIAVETQGSKWKAWLALVDCLVVSPKGPSSGMDSPVARDALASFMQAAEAVDVEVHLKVVVFNDADLEYARWIANAYDGHDLFLSVGTDLGLNDENTITSMLERLRWLSEAVARDPKLGRARVSAQQHVLTWGTQKGV